MVYHLVYQYTNFPQTFDKVDLSHIILRDDFKHPQITNPLTIHISYFDTIASDNDFILELSEKSDSQPYNTTSTTEIYITPHNTTIQIHDPN